MKVVIVQRVLPHYRIPFFIKLRAALNEMQIELLLVYGQETEGSVPRTVDLEATWTRRVENRYLTMQGHELVWQPCLWPAREADLVIVEQASRLLVNYLLLASRLVTRRPRLAFWGHGRNFQARSQRQLSEVVKRAVASRADWWFAYTDMSANEIEAQGVPSDRITVVDNAIDGAALSTAVDAVSSQELNGLRAHLRIERDAPVAVYCGGLHPGKEIDFLLEAAVELRRRVPGFQLVVIGDGPEQHKIDTAAAANPWIHYVGPVMGPERAAYLKLGAALLMPAHVGLVIVDSFIAQVPLIATNRANHSPEVVYLRNEINGLMTDYSIDAYASTVAAYFGDPELQERLRAGCAESAGRYTLDNMVSRFASGIRACLS
jgi:glycosyltransferase involved in cell wall biosynthesis